MTSLSARPLLLFAIVILTIPGTARSQTLEGFASFPADTIAPGPTSGQFITPANGRTPPFVNVQPVQGISSVLRASDGDFLVMSDNGYGAQNNSADYVLRVCRISPDFRTKNDGDGSIEFTARRAAAYQAYYEHMPIRLQIAQKPGPELRIYRRLDWGQLVHDARRSAIPNRQPVRRRRSVVMRRSADRHLHDARP